MVWLHLSTGNSEATQDLLIVLRLFAILQCKLLWEQKMSFCMLNSSPYLLQPATSRECNVFLTDTLLKKKTLFWNGNHNLHTTGKPHQFHHFSLIKTLSTTVTITVFWSLKLRNWIFWDNGFKQQFKNPTERRPQYFIYLTQTRTLCMWIFRMNENIPFFKNYI